LSAAAIREKKIATRKTWLPISTFDDLREVKYPRNVSRERFTRHGCTSPRSRLTWSDAHTASYQSQCCHVIAHGNSTDAQAEASAKGRSDLAIIERAHPRCDSPRRTHIFSCRGVSGGFLFASFDFLTRTRKRESRKDDEFERYLKADGV